MALLDVRDLSLRIHQTPILDAVSFSVTAGEVVGIIGESGSGKSMTANAIMQLLPNGSIPSGEIGFDGQDLLALSDQEMTGIRGNEIGMIFQEPMTALNPLHTIGDQVAEPLRLHRSLGAEWPPATPRAIF